MAESASRASYYSVSGAPTVWFDGVFNEVGGIGGGNMYSYYLPHFNTRKVISSPLTIELTGSYNAGTRAGTVNAHVTNTSGSATSGTIQFVITETNIPYEWVDEDSLFDVARDMLPTHSGEAVSITAGASIDKTRSFTLDTTWNSNNCNIVVFVQKSSKEIYQGAKLHVASIGIEDNIKRNALLLRSNPNPFKVSTVISAQGLETNGSLQIQDLSGRVVKSFSVTPNSTIKWDSKDNNGREVPVGIYFCKLTAGDVSLTKKLILMK